MKVCYKGTSVIMMFTSKKKKKNPTKTLSSRVVNLARTATRDEFRVYVSDTGFMSQTQLPTDLLKQTKYAHRQQLGGPRDALLGMSEAMFTVCLSESADIHCNTSTVGQAISAA